MWRVKGSVKQYLFKYKGFQGVQSGAKRQNGPVLRLLRAFKKGQNAKNP